MEGFQRILGMCWSCNWSMREELNVSNPGSHNQVFQLLSKLPFLRNSKFPSRKRTLLISDIFGYFLFIGVLYQRMKSESFLILSDDQDIVQIQHTIGHFTPSKSLLLLLSTPIVLLLAFRQFLLFCA